MQFVYKKLSEVKLPGYSHENKICGKSLSKKKKIQQCNTNTYLLLFYSVSHLVVTYQISFSMP